MKLFFFIQKIARAHQKKKLCLLENAVAKNFPHVCFFAEEDHTCRQKKYFVYKE